MRKCHLIKSPNYKKKKIKESTSSYGHPHHFSFIENNICLIVSHSKQTNLFTNTIIWDFILTKINWNTQNSIFSSTYRRYMAFAVRWGKLQNSQSNVGYFFMEFQDKNQFRLFKMLHICLIWKLTVIFQKCEEMKVHLPKITGGRVWEIANFPIRSIFNMCFYPPK